MTTEMPPPGRVEVRVAVTKVDDGFELAVVPEAWLDATVLRVVPCWDEEDGATVRGVSSGPALSLYALFHWGRKI